MYTYLFSMILSHIPLQNYFENFPKFKNFPIKILFQACRSTGPVNRSIPGLTGRPGRSTEPWDQGVHVLCTSVGRPTGRPTGSSSLSVFGRSTDSSKRKFSLAAGRPTGRPSPTASCQLDCQSTGPIDRQPSTAPNGSFHFYVFLFWLVFVCQIILIFWGLFLDLINLI